MQGQQCIREILPLAQSCSASFDWLVGFLKCSCTVSNIHREHTRSTEVARPAHQAHRLARRLCIIKQHQNRHVLPVPMDVDAVAACGKEK